MTYKPTWGKDKGHMVKRLTTRNQDLMTILNRSTIDIQMKKAYSELLELKKVYEDFFALPDTTPLPSLPLIMKFRDELADVLITSGQMAIVFGMEEVERCIDFKIDRTLKRLEQPSKEHDEGSHR